VATRGGFWVAIGELKEKYKKLTKEGLISCDDEIQSADTDVSQENITNSIGMTFVYIRPGSFMVGSPSDGIGKPDTEIRRQVTLKKEYYMQTTPVTQTQWEAVMGSSPSEFKTGDRPVEMVSWDDCQEFIKNSTGMKIQQSTVCRPKLSGSMPAGQVQRLLSVVVKLSLKKVLTLTLTRSAGMIRTLKKRPTL